MQRMALEAAKWQPLPSFHHQILEGLVLAMFEFFSTGTSEFMMGKSRMDQLHKWCFSGFQWDLNLPWGFSPSFLMFFVPQGTIPPVRGGPLRFNLLGALGPFVGPGQDLTSPLHGNPNIGRFKSLIWLVVYLQGGAP